jgi:hypothetical protein
MWTHMLGMRKGSFIYIYVNGIMMANTSVGSVSVNNVNDRNLLINRINAGYYGNGIYDDLRIYNRSLSSEEISLLYQSSLSSSGQYIQQPTRAVYGGSGNTDVKLDYLFSPQSPDEAVMIKKIVTMFRFLSTTQSGKDAYNKAIPLGKNPAIWKLSFLNTNRENIFGESIEDYKQKKDDITDRLIYANETTKKNVLPYMVLKSVDVDFGGNDSNWVSFPDGFPPEISLSLSFSSYFSVQSAQTLFGYSSASEILED